MKDVAEVLSANVSAIVQVDDAENAGLVGAVERFFGRESGAEVHRKSITYKGGLPGQGKQSCHKGTKMDVNEKTCPSRRHKISCPKECLTKKIPFSHLAEMR